MLLCLYFALIAQPIDWALYASVLIIAIGIVVRLWASGFIIKNKQLATNGPYSLVRHPLYTGNLLIVYGFVAASGLWWTFIIATVFFVFYYTPAIEYEDRKLFGIFGDAWKDFAKQTPALFPSFGGRSRDLRGYWSFKTSMMVNYEPVIALVLLGFLYLIYTKL